MIRASGRRLREASIIGAFDAARISEDTRSGKPMSLRAYLDDLKPASQRFEESAEELFRQLDRAIARQDAAKQ
jgi:hypothetical protein